MDQKPTAPADESNDRIDPDGSEAQARAQARDAGFMAGLWAASVPDDRHYTADELRSLATIRHSAAGEWLPPDHLACCPICWELFDILRSDSTKVSEEAMQTFASLAAVPVPADGGKAIRFSSYRVWIRLAAGLLFLLAIHGAIVHRAGRTEPSRGTGAWALETGLPLTPGTILPEKVILIASAEGAEATLTDGSIVRLDGGSRVMFRRSLTGSPIFVLQEGRLEAHVAHQPLGSRFTVETDLGSVEVVGTRFTVTRGRETVEIHETSANTNRSFQDNVERMRVDVEEGAVRVESRGERVIVRAGQKATVRANHRWIDVRGTED